MTEPTVAGGAAAPQVGVDLRSVRYLDGGKADPRVQNELVAGDLRSLARELHSLKARVVRSEDKDEEIEWLKACVAEQGRGIKTLEAKVAVLENWKRRNGGTGRGSNAGGANCVGDVYFVDAVEEILAEFRKARAAALENSNERNGGTGHGSNAGGANCVDDIYFVDAVEEILTEFRQRLCDKGNAETWRAKHRGKLAVPGERERGEAGEGGKAKNQHLFEEGEEAQEEEAEKGVFRSESVDDASETMQQSLGTSALGIEPRAGIDNHNQLQFENRVRRGAAVGIEQLSGEKKKKVLVDEELLPRYYSTNMDESGIFQEYKYQLRFWAVPDDFDFPKAKLQDAWNAYLFGFPYNKSPAANPDGSPVLDEEGEQATIPTPIRPLRFLTDANVPLANSKGKRLRKTLRDAWLPVLKYMHGANGARIANTPLNEIDDDFLQATYETGVEALRDGYPELFEGVNADRHHNWNVSTFSQRFRQAKRKRKQNMAVSGEGGEAENEQLFEDGEEVQEKTAKKEISLNRSADITGVSRRKDRRLPTTDRTNTKSSQLESINATLLSLMASTSGIGSKAGSDNYYQLQFENRRRRAAAVGIEQLGGEKKRKVMVGEDLLESFRKRAAAVAIGQPGEKKRRICFPEYRYQKSFWAVPDDFDFPKAKLQDAWVAYLLGFPYNKSPAANPDGSPVLNKEGEQAMIPTPIRPLRFLVDANLPRANSKAKYLRKKFRDAWRPVLKYMHDKNSARIANTPMNEIDDDFLLDTYDDGVEALRENYPELFEGKKADKSHFWSVSTWNQRFLEVKRERRQNMVVPGEGGEAENEQLFEDGEEAQEKAAKKES